MLKATNPIALLCARACELSYDDFKGDAFDKGIIGLGFNDICTIDTAGVQAFCAANADTLLVCFRGTDSGADWLANAMAGKITANLHGNVHIGFLRTLLVVEDQVNDFVMDRPGRNLLITGHSQGAAMAVLHSSRIGREVHALVTFGCPRVGDDDFSILFNQIMSEVSLRFVNNNDAVCRVPLKSWGYRHVWRQQYFDRSGALHEDYKPTPLRKWWDSFSGVLRNLRRLKLGDGITDHSIHDYRRLVETVADLSRQRRDQPRTPGA